MKCEVPLNEHQRNLVEENLPIVRQVIFRHIRCNESICGLAYDDLFQEGAWALCRAAATYDREKWGVPFDAYARPVIRNHLLDYCRHIAAQRKNAPVLSLDAPANEDRPPADLQLPACDETEAWISDICVARLLAYGKGAYSGVARLGVEALELKVKGYTGADIARLYNAKPNHVGAWISRAAKKLREDAAAAQLWEYDAGPRASGF